MANDISPTTIKTLRDRTNAGMMDCRNALVEAGGDLEQAVKILRQKGIASSKKKDRHAGEGVVATVVKEHEGWILEVNSETDFVARNEHFQGLVGHLLEKTAAHGLRHHEALLSLSSKWGSEEEDEATIEHAMAHTSSIIGENIVLRRLAHLEVSPGMIVAYTHGAYGPNMGRIGVLVALQSPVTSKELEELGHKIAMHIAANSPTYVRQEDIPAHVLEEERKILLAQVQDAGKPAAALEKIVEGRLRKYIQEITLEEQPFVVDPEQTVGQAIAKVAQNLQQPIQVAAFLRFAVGEQPH